jgi:hypothetical protein
MTAHPSRPPGNPTPAVELRVLDPGGDHLTLIWQLRNGYGHLLASGQAAGAPLEAGGWRYHALADAAQAAIDALQDLEAPQPTPSPSEGDQHSTHQSQRARTCDFCATAPAAWRYPTRGGQLASVLAGEVLVIVPGGDWYAYPPCHHLVQTGQWEALSAKARLPRDQGAALWAAFRAARTGSPVPLHPQRPNDQHGDTR